MSNKLYSIIKWCAILLLPACGSLYIALSKIWGLPNTFEVSATVAAICTFLGTIIGISSAEYTSASRLQLNKELEELAKEKKDVPTEDEEDKHKVEQTEEVVVENKLKASGKVYLSPSNQYDNIYAYGNTNEADNCEAITKLIKEKLEKAGVEVMVGARNEDMETRCKNSDAFGAQLHIPIHTNAFNGMVMGTRMFYVSDEGRKKGQFIYNKLAFISVGKSDNFSKNDDLYELNNPNAVSVYVEIDFHDAPAAAKWLVEEHELIAETIASGICDALDDGVVIEKKEEAVVVNKSEEESGIGGTCICQAGGEYFLTCNVKIRDGYGTDARWKSYSELSEDGKKHAVPGDMAVLASGTSITCLEVYKNWIRIPSGWMCARDMDGTDNVKVATSDKWCYPVNYIGISTAFSYEHMAYDFGWCDEGGGPYCNVYSTCNGTVLATGEAGTAGKYIYIGTEKDGQYYTFRYCHLSAIHVSPGQSVSRHQHIGQMGGTGGFAPHLHMDLWTGKYEGYMPADRWAACRNYMLNTSGYGHLLLYLDNGQWAGDTTGRNYVFEHI